MGCLSSKQSTAPGMQPTAAENGVGLVMMNSVEDARLDAIRTDVARIKGLPEEKRARHGRCTVRVLNFYKLNWGDEKIEKLAEMLPVCEQLIELRLHGNKFGDAGMLALLPGLKDLPNLKTLQLDGNQIGDKGMAALTDAIGKGAMPSLTKLDVGGNKASKETMSMPNDALEKRK